MYLLVLFCLLFGSLASASENDEIVVRLETEVQLLPLYLGNIGAEKGGFEQSYLTQLEKVLQFDLDHNGMTVVLNKSPEKESLVHFDKMENGVQWRNLHVYYVVAAKVKDRKISLKALSVNNNTLKTIEDVNLTGDLNQDRKSIHQMADSLHKALFGTDGIASTKILYVKKIKSGEKWCSDIWEADYDGGNARQITQEAGYCISPTYVPPKSGRSTGSFFYVSYMNGQPKIFYASLKEKGGKRFSLLGGNQLMPTISPQRDMIAFISDITGNPDLFIQSLDPDTGSTGKPRQIFSAHTAVQGSPTFSPNGKKIAFVSNKDSAARIYVMDIPPPDAKLKDLRPRLISKQNRESTAPCWSPDGTKLAYCALTQGVRQIWIYDFEKNEEKQLTQGPDNKENPSWAPNSLHIIYNSTGRKQSELYLINLNQPKATKISHGPGDKHYPSWEPRN